jgi:hypothetical protein
MERGDAEALDLTARQFVRLTLRKLFEAARCEQRPRLPLCRDRSLAEAEAGRSDPLHRPHRLDRIGLLREPREVGGALQRSEFRYVEAAHRDPSCCPWLEPEEEPQEARFARAVRAQNEHRAAGLQVER